MNKEIEQQLPPSFKLLLEFAKARGLLKSEKQENRTQAPRQTSNHPSLGGHPKSLKDQTDVPVQHAE